MSASEWSVLITVTQAASQAPITAEQRQGILDRLPGGDKWIQYPPASGRGHGFETRWWEDGADAGSVAADATDRYLAAIEAVGLAGIEIILVHVAAPGDRLNEAVVGLERRQGTPAADTDWSVMLRAVPGPDADRRFPAASLERLLEGLRPDASGTGRDGLVEARFWATADDAVAASAMAADRFLGLMAELGHPGWVIVRDHVASVAEAARAGYIGVEKRALALEPDDLPIRIAL
jgi:hypothetical protein